MIYSRYEPQFDCRCARAFGKTGGGRKQQACIGTQPRQRYFQCRRVRRKKGVSTDAVFDGQASGPNGYSETDPVRPINSYAESKALGERNVLSANPDAIVARVNFFGWSISGRRSLSEFFYTNLKAGRVVSGFTDVFFSPLYVRDLSRILVRLLESSERGVFHVFGAKTLSKYDFGVEIAKAFGFNPENVRPNFKFCINNL